MSSIWDGEDTIAGIIWMLTSLGALNWGLVEFADINLVTELGAVAGGSTLEMVIYGVIAAAGVLTLLDHLGAYDVPDAIDALGGGN